MYELKGMKTIHKTRDSIVWEIIAETGASVVSSAVVTKKKLDKSLCQINLLACLLQLFGCVTSMFQGS